MSFWQYLTRAKRFEGFFFLNVTPIAKHPTIWWPYPTDSLDFDITGDYLRHTGNLELATKVEQLLIAFDFSRLKFATSNRIGLPASSLKIFTRQAFPTKAYFEKYDLLQHERLDQDYSYLYVRYIDGSKPQSYEKCFSEGLLELRKLRDSNHDAQKRGRLALLQLRTLTDNFARIKQFVPPTDEESEKYRKLVLALTTLGQDYIPDSVQAASKKMQKAPDFEMQKEVKKKKKAPKQDPNNGNFDF